MTARRVCLDPRTGFDYRWKGHAHYVALHNLCNVESETFADGNPVDHRRDFRGRLTFIPAGCGVWGWSVPAQAPQSFTALYLDPQQMEVDVAKKLTRLPEASELYFSNAILRSTLEKLQGGLSATIRPDAMYLESLCLSAMLELCMFRREDIHHSPRPGHLARSLEYKLVDYVESHLNLDIGLDDLAKIAGLSRYHFVRAFRLTTGKTPYRYLLERRIAAAQRLLRERAMSTAQIAAAVGFKDASSLIRAFRKMTGVTPGAYRVG